MVIIIYGDAGSTIIHEGHTWSWQSFTTDVHGEIETVWDYLANFPVEGAYAVPPDTLEEALRLVTDTGRW